MTRIRIRSILYLEQSFPAKDLEGSGGASQREKGPEPHLIFSRALRSYMLVFHALFLKDKSIKENVLLLCSNIKMRNILPYGLISKATTQVSWQLTVS